MADQFDPYRKWLGISSQDQPPNHYQLLGIPILEEDPDVIENAANRQMAHVRTFQSGKHSKLSQQILNELSVAKRVLLTADKKTEYDTELKSQLPAVAADSASQAAPPPPTPTQQPPPTPVTQPPPHDTVSRQNPATTSRAANSIVQVRSRQPNVVRRHRRKQQKSSAVPLLLAIVALAVLIGIIVLAVNHQKTRPSPKDKSTQKKVSLVTSWRPDKEALSHWLPATAANVAEDRLP